MRETDYVELAFWAGWVEALGYSLTPEELITMRDSLRDQASRLALDYLEHCVSEEGETNA
jgi:hypothetical protein